MNGPSPEAGPPPVTGPAPVAGPATQLPHRLILVRHGQTRHTTAEVISGAGFQPEPGLDEQGIAQAQAAAHRLAALTGSIDQVVVSPLLRARQTAEIITGQLGIGSVDASLAWSEADFGQWEGLTVLDVVQRYPGAWEQMISDPDIGPPGGETLAEVRRRVSAAWRGLLVPSRTTLVVTHLTPIRIVIAEALNTPHEAFGRVLAGPGTITVVDRWSDDGTAVITLGERP